MSADHEAVLAANEAFYRAFNARDARAMESLWAEQCPVYCVHPGWRPLRDRPSVIASWRAILQGNTAPRVTVVNARATVTGEAAWVVCYEKLSDSRGGTGATVATNVFVREQGAWRIAHHHAGPLSQPMDEDVEPAAAATPKRPAPKRTLN